ncbi:hypothetical protein BGZ60DRAFT_564800 [Tricladium varicosporioides]|nr:hypothetical protein BGZ60DRAFT_564800 [Hymenoscyphus varicosporioides]
MTTTTFTPHPPLTFAGTTTTYLPLTSAWPSINQCNSDIYWIPDGSAVIYDPSIGASNTLLRCLPPEATQWWLQSKPTPQFTVTSLGPVVCPQAYTTAFTRIEGEGTTLVACCPTNYIFTELQTPLYTGSKGQCISSLTSGQKFIFYTASAGSFGPWILSTSIWGTPSTQTGSVHAVPINGYVFATTSLTSGVGASSTSMSSIIGPAKATIATSGSGNVGGNTGLSPGEKAGIGVGAALIVLLLIMIGLGALWFVRSRKRSRGMGLGSEMDVGDGYAMRTRPEVTDHHVPKGSPDLQKRNYLTAIGTEAGIVGGAKPELEALGNQRHEMDGARDVEVQELDGGGIQRRGD